jgi:hypothetical protein
MSGEKDSPYVSTYAAHYSRPQTGMPVFSRAALGSGFSGNNRISVYQLEELPDSRKPVTSSQAYHCEASSLNALRNPKPVVRGLVEHSGYWTSEPKTDRIGCSAKEDRRVEHEREAAMQGIHPKILARIRHHSQIEAENGGAGPRWGSTTHGATYGVHDTSRDRWRAMDRGLIGQKEPDAFTRQRPSIPTDLLEEPVSVAKRDFVAPPRTRDLTFPSRTVMTPSGFSTSERPLVSRYTLLSDVNLSELHPVTVKRIRQKDPVEYHKILEPNPYKSSYQVTFQSPKQRGVVTAEVARGYTGYCRNEWTQAGAPGDPSTFKVGRTITEKHYKDPATLRTRDVGQVPNVIDRSGYWGQ